MTVGERIAVAGLIIVVDVVLFAVPLTGLVAAWILLARPLWFRRWVEQLYGNAPRDGCPPEHG